MNKEKFFALGFWISVFVFLFFLVSGERGHISNVYADTATTSATISNSVPSVGTVSINNGDSTITLIEGDSSSVKATTTVTITDNNGCSDITGVTVKFYRTDQGSSCTANGYNCYSSTSCSAVTSGNTCDGSSTDTSVDYQCSITLNYYTDPTDANAAASSTNWTMLITATDNNSATGNGSDTIEVSSLSAIDVTSPIGYGTLALGADSSDQTQTVTNTGNVRLDLQFSGTDMSCDTGSIGIAQQKYSTTTISSWADAPYTLSSSATERDWDLAKSTGSTSTASVHWMLEVPSSGVEGACSGSNTLTAVNDDVTQD